MEEVNDVFSKCGVIAEEIDRRRPRIKMYTDDEGKFKGDALIVYFRPESVKLAIQMLDDTDFRFGETGPQGKMKVQAADFSFKVQKEAPVKQNMNEKRKIMKKTQRLNRFVLPLLLSFSRKNSCWCISCASLCSYFAICRQQTCGLG